MKSRQKRQLTLSLAFFLTVMLFCMLKAGAAETPLPSLPTTNIGHGPSDATVVIGLREDGGASYVTSVSAGTPVEISASIKADPEHIGQQADIFVARRIGKVFTIKNTDGVYVPWNKKIPELVPALEAVELTETIDVDVFSGELTETGPLFIYVAYMPYGSDGLIYNHKPGRFEITEKVPTPYEYFEANIAHRIIGTRCVVCHTAGGVADGRTSLLYERDADSAKLNFDILNEFFNSTDNAVDYILSKASGGEEHTGGIQLPVGSGDYKLLEQFLLLLDGAGGALGTPAGGDFFAAVTLQSRQETLRRAAILLAGRVPTESEKQAVASGNDATLRQVVKGLMEGENFHEFLLDAANDRLLVRGLGRDTRIIRECIECFPVFANALHDAEKRRVENGLAYPEQALNRQMDKAMIESPLELIAWVVENDLPFSEILTADYMMLNPLLNEMLGGTATFDDPDELWQYRPGKVEGMYLRDASMEVVFEQGIAAGRVDDPGDLHTVLPHAGVLSSRAFLTRYPTTATNRNRARARWTYYHFLDVDIERSAQRTTDPEALSDTNNPTMNNPNCSICHERMDPVAGAFQNYAPQGQYRAAFGGTDSLDDFYKYPEDGMTLYRDGDTWYRDMRAPGYLQKTAPDAANSLQWLAGEIVDDPGFLTAAVKFWWPAVTGGDVLLAPEVVTDADYAARLLAFEAQNSTIEALAASFQTSGMNVKDLLADLVMSPWFRAGTVADSELSPEITLAHEIAGLGGEKLLTPEQLQRKTRTLTGYTWLNIWNLFDNETYTDAMDRLYGKYYGGIDSNAVTTRTRQMTPMMGTVPIVHALEVSCPVVLREFILPDSRRKLFGGITPEATPENGENAIRQKLAELHEIMLGGTYAADDPAIDETYGLFVDSWNERRNSGIEPSLFNSVDYCPWGLDFTFGEGLDFEGGYVTLQIQTDGKPVLQYNEDFLPYLVEKARDPLYTKQAWRTVLAYLLSHYDYLYE